MADFSLSSGYEKAGELLEKYGDLDGLVCATDIIAAGAMQYLQEHGIPVPEQILVAGQGDSDIAKVTSPPLLTVRYPYEKSGEIAIQMMLEILEKGETALKEVKLGYHIVDGKEGDKDAISDGQKG